MNVLECESYLDPLHILGGTMVSEIANMVTDILEFLRGQRADRNIVR